MGCSCIIKYFLKFSNVLFTHVVTLNNFIVNIVFKYFQAETYVTFLSMWYILDSVYVLNLWNCLFIIYLAY